MTFIPPIFISHGSPMLMLEPGRTGPAWRALAQGLPRARARSRRLVAALRHVSGRRRSRSPAFRDAAGIGRRALPAGHALQTLARNDVLIMASGGLTHNLRDIVADAEDGATLPYVAEFGDWFVQTLLQRDLPALFDWHRRAPHAARGTRPSFA